MTISSVMTNRVSSSSPVQVLYNMAIWMNETEVVGSPSPLAMPSVNVSLTGTVPTAPATFRLDLPCTGLASAEVDVIFNINVTSPRPRQPPTVLYFKRRKICFEGQSAEMYAPHLGPLGERGDALPVVYYVVPALAGLTLVVTIIIIARPMTNSTLLRAATPNNNTYTLPSSVTINSYASLRKLTTPITPLTPLTPAHAHNHVSTTASLTPCSRESGSREVCDLSRDSGSRDTCQSSSSLSRSEVIVDPSAAELQERFRQMEVERQRVRLTAVAHEGSFGRVFRGWIQRDRPEQDQQVLIKTVTEGAPHDEVVALYREGTHLFNLYHRNVLTMVGISFADNSSPFLIYPFHGYHNLKQYLQEHRGGHLRAAELVELAVQAAHGLSFLHTANVLHGDLAARNCVVSEKLQLRITDAALSRDLFPTDYESVGAELARPIKWLSYEAITDRVVSTASDVPYVEVAACEMGEYLRDGYRLAQPLNCPDDLYKVMAFCWAIHPHDRPHAKLILDYLAAFHQQLNSFI
ncbi:Tyrosine-protein kinase RYK-like [Homarus americanus]|uniref:Tyrosine-protein kinase RYK-like n=1 Tax=Homarus americanus TaxID=6706 RepID=A0A8J5N0G2_HOMAM|nr:Tyrosine-protein kinase RYK-like [Homarus americanus]